MQKILLFITLILAIHPDARSQTDTLKWINEHAREIRTNGNTDDLSDWSFLKKELEETQIIGIGEASHGTHEFYTEKARIIRYLIEKCGFRTIAFEAPGSMMMPIDSFIRTGQGDLKKVMKGMGLYGAEEIYQLFLGLADYNQTALAGKRVKLIGIDKPEYWSDPISRDGFMAENLRKVITDLGIKTILWAHNVHLQKDTTAQYLAMGGFLKKFFGNRYFALALDTYQGSVSILSQQRQFETHTFETDPATFSAMLSKARLRQFYLKFNPSKDPFKGRMVYMTNIYANWTEPKPKPVPIHPGIDFDAVLFIKSTTASKEIN
jgi:erythromycin esterase-like protein